MRQGYQKTARVLSVRPDYLVMQYLDSDWSEKFTLLRSEILRSIDCGEGDTVDLDFELVPAVADALDFIPKFVIREVSK